LNLGIGLCHPPVGAILFVGYAVGKVSIEQVMRKIWPFYGVMFLVLMFVTYIPEISLWLPTHVLRYPLQQCLAAGRLAVGASAVIRWFRKTSLGRSAMN